MTKTFEECERECKKQLWKVSNRCMYASFLFCGEKKKQEFSELQVALDEADVLLQEMDTKARSSQVQDMDTRFANLGKYQSELKKLKRDVKQGGSYNLNVLHRKQLLDSGMASTISEMTTIESCVDNGLWMEIFKLLPVPALVSFQDVSEEWGSRIRNRDFINLFREFSNSRRDCCGFLIESGTRAENQSCDIFLYYPGKPPVLIFEGQYFDRRSPHLQSVDGLAMIEDVILNPTTGKKLQLPPLDVEVEDGTIPLRLSFLGFTPVKYEYKVLSLTVKSKLVNGLAHNSTIGKVFTLGESAWRSLEKPLPDCLTRTRSLLPITYCCSRGVIYIYPPRTMFLVAFDLATEDSKILFFHVDHGLPSKIALYEFKGKIAVFNERLNCFWILEDEISSRWEVGVIDHPPPDWFSAYYFLFDMRNFPELKELLHGRDFHVLKYVATFLDPTLSPGTDQYKGVSKKDEASTEERKVAKDEHDKNTA